MLLTDFIAKKWIFAIFPLKFPLKLKKVTNTSKSLRFQKIQMFSQIPKGTQKQLVQVWGVNYAFSVPPLWTWCVFFSEKLYSIIQYCKDFHLRTDMILEHLVLFWLTNWLLLSIAMVTVLCHRQRWRRPALAFTFGSNHRLPLSAVYQEQQFPAERFAILRKSNDKKRISRVCEWLILISKCNWRP